MLGQVPELHLDPEAAFFIVLKAREFHTKVEEVDPDEGSNPADDRSIDVLQFQAGDTVQEELFGAIGSLNEDARRDLLALIRLGRGDFAIEAWREARERVGSVDPEHVADTILGLPNVSDYLEEGLAAFGHALRDVLDGHFAATRDALVGA